MLQRWILVQSYIYYQLDDNIVSDRMYDMNARQLIKLQKKYPNIKTEYSKIFSDFESGTGFDLISRLSKKQKANIKKDSEMAIKVKKKYGKKKQ